LKGRISSNCCRNEHIEDNYLPKKAFGRKKPCTITKNILKFIRKVDQKIALINVRFGQGYLPSCERVLAYPPY